MLWSPGVPSGPSLEAFERIAPSVESRGFLNEDPLSASALEQNVDVYGALPNHYTGTPYDALELDVIKRELGADGLKLGQISYSFPENVPTRVGLTVGSVHEPASALAPEQYSGVTGPGGVSGQLYYGGKGTGSLSAGAGKIMVFSGGSVLGRLQRAPRPERRRSSRSPRVLTTSRTGRTSTPATAPARSPFCTWARTPARVS